MPADFPACTLRRFGAAPQMEPSSFFDAVDERL
jgi:hypothetical protein